MKSGHRVRFYCFRSASGVTCVPLSLIPVREEAGGTKPAFLPVQWAGLSVPHGEYCSSPLPQNLPGIRTRDSLLVVKSNGSVYLGTTPNYLKTNVNPRVN